MFPAGTQRRSGSPARSACLQDDRFSLNRTESYGIVRNRTHLYGIVPLTSPFLSADNRLGFGNVYGHLHTCHSDDVFWGTDGTTASDDFTESILSYLVSEFHLLTLHTSTKYPHLKIQRLELIPLPLSPLSPPVDAPL